jgi:hypothetical protein
VIEDELKNLRLLSSASAPRDRILARARSAQNDKRIGRVIHRVAAVTVALALVAVALGEEEGPRSRAHAYPDIRPQVVFPDESLQEVRP